MIKELYIDRNTLNVKCVYLNTERRWAKHLKGENITSEQFDLTDYLETNAKFDTENAYIRITLDDGQGGKAWTGAYSEKELKTFIDPN